LSSPYSGIFRVSSAPLEQVLAAWVKNDNRSRTGCRDLKFDGDELGIDWHFLSYPSEPALVPAGVAGVWCRLGGRCGRAADRLVYLFRKFLGISRQQFWCEGFATELAKCSIIRSHAHWMRAICGKEPTSPNVRRQRTLNASARRLDFGFVPVIAGGII
jgi:hypothetical protein